MPPRQFLVPRCAFQGHAKHLQNRIRIQRRFASTTAALEPWRGKDPLTRLGGAITGSMEWQHSMYSFNKHTSKTLPVAAANAERILQAYVTMKAFDTRKTDARAIRAALATRRKSADKIYISKPQVKDYGDRIVMTAFIYDGKSLETDFASRGGKSETDLEPSRADVLAQPARKIGVESLLARIYGKPLTLNLVRLAKPHLNADILAAVVTQRLRDRFNTPRRVIRDAIWKSTLPSRDAITSIKQTKEERMAARGTNFSWRDMTLGSAAQTTAASIHEGLGLSQVSSIEVSAAGRLTKRLTANRSQRKVDRRGANTKGPAHVLRGHQKTHVQHAFSSGKRRVGQFGINVWLGHT